MDRVVGRTGKPSMAGLLLPRLSLGFEATLLVDMKIEKCSPAQACPGEAGHRCSAGPIARLLARRPDSSTQDVHAAAFLARLPAKQSWSSPLFCTSQLCTNIHGRRDSLGICHHWDITLPSCACNCNGRKGEGFGEQICAPHAAGIRRRARERGTRL